MPKVRTSPLFTLIAVSTCAALAGCAEATDDPTMGAMGAASSSNTGASSVGAGAGTGVVPGGTATDQGSTGAPGATTGGTTAMPGGTTAMPGGTTAMPGGTTAMPGGTTAMPGGTTAMPGGTTAMPGGDPGGDPGAGDPGGGDPGAGDPGGGDPGAGDPGGGTPGTAGEGYWVSNDWHGCTWTGVGDYGATTIMPQDFVSQSPDEPYCVSGTVGADEEYRGVSLLGFNIAEEGPADCSYMDGEAPILPAVEIPNWQSEGIAISLSQSVGSILRVQIQGPDGATDDSDRWCMEIEDPTLGVAYAPYADFNTECWEGGEGEDYAGQPISAVVFLVPGRNEDDIEFGYCINGFQQGTSVDDAPEGGTSGPISGTITEDLGRAKVSADGKTYIIQNNNWGPNAGSQTIEYTGNSFTVTQQTGGAGGNGEPASFPSIYIGSNGNSNGSFSTTANDNLPMQISAINSIPTTLSWGGGGGDYNVSYDVWFKADDSVDTHETGESAFLMVWYYKPGNRSPIGSIQRQFTLDGKTFDVWQGPRNDGSQFSNAPVVSYVATTTIDSWSFDLNAFIDDAVANHGFNTGWYLSDVFAGFEIWSGGQGATVNEFTAVVQ